MHQLSPRGHRCSWPRAGGSGAGQETAREGGALARCRAGASRERLLTPGGRRGSPLASAAGLTVLLVTNAVLVIALQPLVLRVLSPTTLRASLALAGACYSVSSLLYAMGSVSIWPFIVSMIFLSIGEATIGVGESLYIDLIASKEQRSFYFSCLSLINSGSMIGPPLCGLLIAHSSYTDAFLSLAVGPLVGALLFARSWPKPAGAAARETCPSGTQSSSQVRSTSAIVDP